MKQKIINRHHPLCDCSSVHSNDLDLDTLEVVVFSSDGLQSFREIKISDSLSKFRNQDFKISTLLANGVPLTDMRVSLDRSSAERIIVDGIEHFMSNENNFVQPEN